MSKGTIKKNKTLKNIIIIIIIGVVLGFYNTRSFQRNNVFKVS